MYSIEGLERGIESSKKNIKVFEDAIKKERETMAQYYEMIDVLKRKKIEAETKKLLEKPISAN